MKRIITVLLMAAVILTAGAAGCSAASGGLSYKTAKTGAGYVTRFYDGKKCVGKVKTAKRLKVKMVKSEKLTGRKLSHRKNKYIVVEVIAGKCIDSKGNGRTSDGCYISYKRVKGHKRGTRYTTYCVYGNNNAVDDVVIRADFKR